MMREVLKLTKLQQIQANWTRCQSISVKELVITVSKLVISIIRLHDCKFTERNVSKS